MAGGISGGMPVGMSAGKMIIGLSEDFERNPTKKMGSFEEL